ncbi:MAG: hypothetical protein ABIR81_10560 [Ginsengibacter sp.]
MDATYKQQEILLITGNHFAQREWAEKIKDDKSRLTPMEELEEACWNGLLPDLLPELFEDKTLDKKQFLLRIKHCRSFLEIDLGENFESVEADTSIDPYLFVGSLILS